MSFGQWWANAYPNSGQVMWNEGQSIKQTSDGGYILVGKTRMSSDLFAQYKYELFLLKLDSNGNEVWRRTFGPSLPNGYYELQNNCVIETNDGGFVFVAKVDSSFSGDIDKHIGLFKVDPSGNDLWSRFFIGSGGYSIIESANNELVILTQQKDLSPGGNQDQADVLIKTDNLGNQIWTLNLAVNSSDLYEKALQETPSGNYIMVLSNGGYSLLINVDTNGNELWQQLISYNDDNSSQATAVLPVSNGFIISGATFNNGLHDLWLAKTDLTGNKIWENTYGAANNLSEGSYSIDYTQDNGFILAGSGEKIINGYELEQNMMLLKVDENGNEQWQNILTDLLFAYDYDNNYVLTKYYGESDAYSVSTTNDGGYILTGYYEQCAYTDSLLPYYSGGNIVPGLIGYGTGIIVIKTDGNGNVASTFNLPLSTENKELIKIVDVLGRETPFKPNTPLLYIYNDGTVERKMIIK